MRWISLQQDILASHSIGELVVVFFTGVAGILMAFLTCQNVKSGVVPSITSAILFQPGRRRRED